MQIGRNLRKSGNEPLSAPAPSAPPAQEPHPDPVTEKPQTSKPPGQCGKQEFSDADLSSWDEEPFATEEELKKWGEERRMSPFWFVSYLGFEEKESDTNRLVMNLRMWSMDRPRTVTFYLRHPITISTEPQRSVERTCMILDNLMKDSEIWSHGPTVYLPAKQRCHRADLEKSYPGAEFVIEDRGDFVVNITLPCDKRLLDRLDRKGFQVGNHNKQINRQLKWRYRKVELDNVLIAAADSLDRISDMQESVSSLVSLAYPIEPSNPSSSAARTRVMNELVAFFALKGDIATLRQPEVRKAYPSISRFHREHPDLMAQVAVLERELNVNVFSMRHVLKALDRNNDIMYSKESKSYEVVLGCQTPINKPNSPLSTAPKGISVSFDRIPYECWKRLSTCIIDIEKPMWRTDEQRALVARLNSLQMELTDLSSGKDRDGIEDEIREVMRGLIFRSKESGDIDLTDERYKEQISSVQLHLLREDGSETKFYFKLALPSQMKAERRESNGTGFVTLLFDDEYSLVSSMINVLKAEKPYRLIGHVIPYDLTNTRDAARELKAGRMDIIINRKEPRLWRRAFYQKMTAVAQEVFDTHRIGTVWFPYLKSAEFGMSHKLTAVANFVWREKRRLGMPTAMKEEFRKIATHDQLKELEIKRLNGDAEAGRTLDQYSTSDLAPVQEIFTFEPMLRSIYDIGELMPHASLADIAFSPTAISEMFHEDEWDYRHTQLNFGYTEKKREDERQIFKRRLAAYMRRQLADEGIMPVKRSGPFTGVYMAYVPLEQWTSATLFPHTPEWQQYFHSMSSDPIVRFGQLQYPKNFMRRHVHVDYYLYRREIDIVRECVRKSGMEWGDVLDLFQRYYTAVSAADGSVSQLTGVRQVKEHKSLIRQYHGAYNSLKDQFRTFYMTLKMEGEEGGARTEEASRLKRRIKTYLQSPGGRRDDIQMLMQFTPFFDEENKDLISLNDIPKEFEDALTDTSKRQLSEFKKTFNRLKSLEKEIIRLLQDPANSDLMARISAENLVFMFNQHSLARHRQRVFYAVYHIEPEGQHSFRELLDSSYRALGAWITSIKRDMPAPCGLQLLGFKSDYIFLRRSDGRDIDFTNAPLIPIRKFDELEFGGDEDIADGPMGNSLF